MEESSKNSNYISNNQTNIVNLVNVVYDDEIVLLINSLSKSIKEYYKSTKKAVAELNSIASSFSNQTLFTKCLINEISLTKTMSKLPQLAENVDIINENKNIFDSHINNIDQDLHDFFEEARKLFKQMKNTRNQKIEDFISNNCYKEEEKVNNDNNVIKSYSNRKDPSNSPNFTKIIEDREKSKTPNPFVRSSSVSSSARHMKLSKSLDKIAKNSKKLYTQANCSLSLRVIHFLSEMATLQDSILKKYSDVQERKLSFERTKSDLRKQAQMILNKDYLTSFNSSNYHYNAIKHLADDNRNKSDIIERCNNQIEKLKNEIVDLVSENNKFKQNFKQLSSITLSSVDQNQIIKNLKNEVSNLRAEMKEKNLKMTDLIDQISNDNTKNALEKLQIEYTLLDENYKQKLLEIEEKNKIISKTQIELNEAFRKYRIDREKFKNLENQLYSKEILLNKYSKDLKAMQTMKEKNANSSIHKNLILTQKNNEINQLAEQNSYYEVVISNLKTDVTTLQQTIKTNADTINKLNNQNLKLNNTLQNKIEEIEELKQQLNGVNIQSKDIEPNSNIEKEKNMFNGKIEQLEKDKSKFKELINEKLKEIELLTNKNHSLLKQIENTENENLSLKQKITEKDTSLLSKDKTIIELNNKIDFIIKNQDKKLQSPKGSKISGESEKKIEELQKKVKILEELNEKYTLKIKEISELSQEKINNEKKGLKTEIDSLKEKSKKDVEIIIKLSNELDNEKIIKENLMSVKQNLETKIESLLGKENEVNILNKQLSELKNEINKNSDEIELYKKKLKENDATIKKLREKQNVAISSNDVWDTSKENKNQNYLEKIEELKLINLSLEEKKNIFKNEAQTQKKKNEEINSQLNSEKQLNEKLKLQIKEFDEKNGSLTNEIKMLQAEIEGIKVNQTKEEIEKNSMNNSSVGEIEEKNAKIKFLSEQKDFFENSVKNLKEKVYQLEEKITQKEKEELSLKEKNAELLSEITNIQENKKTEISIMQDEYKSAKKEIEELKQQIAESSTSKSIIQKYCPDSYTILTNRTFNHLTWYLLSSKTDHDSLNYENCIWVPHSLIEKDLPSYNKFVSEQEEQNRLIQIYTSKLEKKEEELSKLSYSLEKIKEINSQKNEQSFNSSLSKKPQSKVSDNKIIVQDYLNLTGQNQGNNQEAILLEKYNSALNKLNETEIQLTKIQKENAKLKNEIKEKSNYDCASAIDKHNNTISVEEEIKDVFSERSGKKPGLDISGEMNIKKIKDRIQSLKDERNAFQKQLVFIKASYKELNEKYNILVNEIKEFIVVLQVTPKIKENVKNICKLLDYSDPDISVILKDQEKKKGFFGFLKK